VKSLQSHEQNLAGSQYGKYFTRNMNSLLLKRDPDAWRARQASKGEVPIPSAINQTKPVHISAPGKSLEQSLSGVSPKPSSKRKRKGGDDIDKLFDSALVRKQKRGALPLTQEERKAFVNPDTTGLESILGAIKDAPKEDKGRKHKKKKAL
jgi:nucleolar protein 9